MSPNTTLDAWNAYLADAQAYLPQSNTHLILLTLLNIPVIAVVLNVLWQLIVPRRATDPPVIFHWLPYVGSAIQYGNDPMSFFFSCREKASLRANRYSIILTGVPFPTQYGDVFTFVLLGRKVTVALGPKGNSFVLGGKSTVLNAEDAYTPLTTPIFGKDVVYDVPNEIFMEQKRFVKVGLTSDNFRTYVGMIEEEVEDFLAQDSSFRVFQANDVKKWGEFDVCKVMQEITILTASRTLQGKEVREGLNKSFSGLYNDLDGGFTPLNWMFPNLPLASYRRRDAAHIKMSAFYVDIIKKRRASGNVKLIYIFPPFLYAHKHPCQHGEPDMIEALMQQKYRGGKPLKDHEIAHIMIALLMAGQHTSSATGSWALLHIAANPEIAEALYEEQIKHFSTPDGKLRSMTYEELRELPLMDAVIRETLRMHPPIHSIMRKVRDDVVVPPSLSSPSEDKTYIVPKGHFVMSSPAVSQTDPRVWRDALNWDPYRWSDPEGVAAQAFETYEDKHGEKIDYGFGAVSKGTESPYQPFGAGKHRCIGEQV
ncbi:hypothetical protein C0993_007825 [Termitomyces sp. T159_Od127]|nr:hypothetical protein C0993_007825 [Termitomyces sp. T159_Od127]